VNQAPTPRILIILAYAAIYFLWGGSYLAIRWAVETIPPAAAMGPRNLIGGVVLFAVAVALRLRRLDRRQRIGATIVGFLYFTLAHGMLATAQTHIPSGVAALVFSTVPIWIVLFDWLTGRRAPSWRVAVGLALGFAGIAVLVQGRGSGGTVDPLWGVITLVGGVIWAIGTVTAVRLLPGSNPVRASGLQLIVGGAGLTLYGFFTGDIAGLDIAQISWRSIAGFAYLLFAGTFVSFVAFNWLMVREPAARVATYAFVNPAVAVLLGWLVESEPLSAVILIAMAMIIGAVALVVLDRR